MIVLIDKSLEKDVKKLKDKSLKLSLAKVVEELQIADNLSSIRNIKKLQGAKNFYRIRIGDYRLGLISSGNEVQLIRLLHRKDIYKYFP
jgi:mRNA interferase RelE/StbE